MITIFTDGSSRGNPGPGGWGVIIETEDSVVELGGRENETTNNRMELTAVISALNFVSTEFPNESGVELSVYTDSAYVVNGITRWVFGWKKNNWKTSQKEDVLNRDLWEKLYDLTSHKVIKWNLVKGHSGHPANERCDVIATSFADKKSIVLYNGSKARYGVSLSKLTSQTETKKSKSKAYSYVSLVDGEIKVHKTWEECKGRVNGVPNAKYKKTTSPSNEEEVIREFVG